MPESVSSLLGSEVSEGPLVAPPQRGDDDSLSAESMDSVHGEESLCQSVSARLTYVLTFLTIKINGCFVLCVCVCVLLEIHSQCNQSPSPRHHTDTSSAASWSRHLIQQTLMDEGLRLARMVSRDRVCRINQGSERAHCSGDFNNSKVKSMCALYCIPFHPSRQH